jgi:hypothetical protein
MTQQYATMLDEVLALRSENAALRNALQPFADYYDTLERNGRLEGHMLISQQGSAILGHADIQTRDLKAAREVLNQQIKQEG